MAIGAQTNGDAKFAQQPFDGATKFLAGLLGTGRMLGHAFRHASCLLLAGERFDLTSQCR